MASSLSNLVSKLSEGIHRIKGKFGQDNKRNVRHVELNMSIVSVFFNAKILNII